MRNPSPVESPTDKASEPVYSVGPPTVPDADRLALEWILDPSKGRELSERILARLIQAEARESLVYYEDDYRQAFICVTLASRGNTIPFVVSSYQMYGLHPDKVYPAILARRKALLGPTGADITTTQPSHVSAPASKKPSRSVRDEERKRAL